MVLLEGRTRSVCEAHTNIPVQRKIQTVFLLNETPVLFANGKCFISPDIQVNSEIKRMIRFIQTRVFTSSTDIFAVRCKQRIACNEYI